MDHIVASLRNLLDRLSRATPHRRTTAPDTDWLPPMLGASDLSSPYFLAMADRDTAWYFDRR